jgi:hypothetical protein
VLAPWSGDYTMLVCIRVLACIVGTAATHNPHLCSGATVTCLTSMITFAQTQGSERAPGNMSIRP